MSTVPPSPPDTPGTTLAKAARLLRHTEQSLDALPLGVADLRAMHGCLTTGPLLAAPARDDLHTLLTDLERGDGDPATDGTASRPADRPEEIPA